MTQPDENYEPKEKSETEAEKNEANGSRTKAKANRRANKS